MASIGNVTSSSTQVVTTVVDPTGSTGATGNSSPSSAPLFQETLTTQGRIFGLGLGAPRNFGDIEALFAEIATKFGGEVGKATDFAEAAEDAKRSTALRASIGTLGFCASLSATIQAATLNIARQTAIIGQLNKEITDLNGQKTELQTELAGLQSQKASLDTQIGQIGAQIGTKYSELNALQASQATACGADAASATCISATQAVNDKTAEISALQTQFNSLNTQMSGVLAQISSVNSQIADIDAQISVLNGRISTANASKNASQSNLNLATTMLNFFSTLFLPSAVSLALLTINEMARASFEMLPTQLGLEKAIEDAANNIADKAEEMGNFSVLLKALGREPGETDSAGDGAVQGTPPAEGRGAIDLLLLLMAEFVPSNSDSPEVAQDDTNPQEPGEGPPVDGKGPKPSAFELIQQALEVNLPPGAGSPEAVQARATELAGILALVRGALAQIANGEAGMNTNVPGPSGRLTLAI